jgi:hypothetical protein
MARSLPQTTVLEFELYMFRVEILRESSVMFC